MDDIHHYRHGYENFFFFFFFFFLSFRLLQYQRGHIGIGDLRTTKQHMRTVTALTGCLPRGLNSDKFLACSASIMSIATCNQQ